MSDSNATEGISWKNIVNGSDNYIPIISSSFLTSSIILQNNNTIKILDAIYTDYTGSFSSGSLLNITSLLTSSYTGMFVEYVLFSGSNARAGNISSIWNSTNIVYNEYTTTDIGSTSNTVLSLTLSGQNVNILGTTNTNNWSIKAIIKMI
jgi:hypothetical protein